MDAEKLKALAAEGFKNRADLNQFFSMLTKLTVEQALKAELTDDLECEKMPRNYARIPTAVIHPKRFCTTMVQLRGTRHVTVKISFSPS